jgi:hypothetical protein
MVTQPSSDTLYRVEEERKQLEAATRRFRRAEEARERAKEEVAVAIVAALHAGVSPTDVANAAPFTPAYVRRIAKAAGVEPAPPGPKPKRDKPRV